MSDPSADSNPVSFRLSPEAKRMLRQLEDWLGLKRTGIAELAIRRLHQAESKVRSQAKGKE